MRIEQTKLEKTIINAYLRFSLMIEIRKALDLDQTKAGVVCDSSSVIARKFV